MKNEKSKFLTFLSILGDDLNRLKNKNIILMKMFSKIFKMMIIVKINLIIHTICNDDNDYYYNDDNNNSNNKKDNNN